MSASGILLPEDFEDYNFALNNKEHFDKYIDMIIKGYDETTALRVVFGEEACSDGGFWARIYAIRRNRYYNQQYQLALQNIKLEELWNPRLAITMLLLIARSSEKHSARINAIKELNIMTGITVMDEAGNTKQGRSMEDFYAKIQESADSHYPPANGTTKH
ncbi:hypothetical protein KYLE_1 [Pantoea phage Kyle]|uniref:Uncharacterized protein n=1 Tax=Pantoea phage Kyle TaxID=2589665 RepID=A0A514A8S4_9CAUD|nr:hypothetical protein HWC52_gp001 [Pantoea phage Kyle]YP_009849939.1 hypothetical protein HWC52_gp107 [Pantoea phage Kyle]QDH49595.1 hypothetical protein KYLE_107 [Pantoea phage Kyle]QDH49666.1 hypothetical protein KYLE_1 [Pantoea phage Kyle]